MGRPSKYGEPTTAIRIPASKLPLVLETLEQGFVQNYEDAIDDVLDGLVEQYLQRCEDLDIDPKNFLLRLIFRDLCDKLDQYPQREQHKFVVWLCDRYLVGDK